MKLSYLIVPFAPLIGAILAGLWGRQIGRKGAHTVTILGVLLARVIQHPRKRQSRAASDVENRIRSRKAATIALEGPAECHVSAG